VSEGERALRRPVEIDLDLHCDLHAAALSDDLNDAVDYVVVWEVVARVASSEHCLVEALGEHICTALLATFPSIDEVRIVVRKLAPLAGAVSSAGVSLTRRRMEDR
jgi:dihydroneopterin aldolase